MFNSALLFYDNFNLKNIEFRFDYKFFNPTCKFVFVSNSK